MKKLLLVLTVVLMTSCGSTYNPVNIEPVTKAFKAEGSKNDLYVSANSWMVENSLNALTGVQFSDKEEGIIIAKYLLQPIYSSTGYTIYQSDGIYAIVRLQMKDNLSKITVKADNFLEIEASRDPDLPVFTKEDAIEKINKLISSYENYLKTEDFSF